MQNKDINEIGGYSMSLRTYRIILLGVLLTLIIAASAAVSLTAFSEKAPDTAAHPKTFTYYLKEYDGTVGAFYTGSATPFYTLTVPLDTLPDTDRADLKKGIYIEDEARLRRIIEDFEG